MSKWANFNINKTRRLLKIGHWACRGYCKDICPLLSVDQEENLWKSVSLKSDNFLIAPRKFAPPLAQTLGGGEAEFVICARVRIIGFLQPMVIRWLPYLVNLSPGMINLITGGQAGQGKDRAGERWGGKKQVGIRRAKTAALPLLWSQKKGGQRHLLPWTYNTEFSKLSEIQSKNRKSVSLPCVPSCPKSMINTPLKRREILSPCLSAGAGHKSHNIHFSCSAGRYFVYGEGHMIRVVTLLFWLLQNTFNEMFVVMILCVYVCVKQG